MLIFEAVLDYVNSDDGSVLILSRQDAFCSIYVSPPLMSASSLISTVPSSRKKCNMYRCTVGSAPPLPLSSHLKHGHNEAEHNGRLETTGFTDNTVSFGSKQGKHVLQLTVFPSLRNWVAEVYLMYILKKPGGSSLRTELPPPSRESQAPIVEMLPAPPPTPFGLPGLLHEADIPAGFWEKATRTGQFIEGKRQHREKRAPPGFSLVRESNNTSLDSTRIRRVRKASTRQKRRTVDSNETACVSLATDQQC